MKQRVKLKYHDGRVAIDSYRVNETGEVPCHFFKDKRLFTFNHEQEDGLLVYWENERKKLEGNDGNK